MNSKPSPRRLETPPPPPDSLFLTIPEAGAALRISRAKVYLLANKGRLELVKIDRSARITRRSVEALAFAAITARATAHGDRSAQANTAA